MDIKICSLIFLIFLGIYLYTSPPTIPPGDSGEFISAAYNLDIPHPSGYPLYCILGKIFTVIIPYSNIAYRVNFMSNFFSLLSCILIYLISILIFNFIISNSNKFNIKEKTKNGFLNFFSNILILIPVILFGFCWTLWKYSIRAEVYTLNIFFVSLITYITLLLYFKHSNEIASITSSVNLNNRIIKEKFSTKILELKYLYLLSFLFGLGLGNHQTIILVIPAICYLIYTIYKSYSFSLFETDKHQTMVSKEIPQNIKSSYGFLLKTGLILLLFFIIGFCVYLYLPIRSLKDPYIDRDNPQNLTNFINIFLRKDYGTFKLSAKTGPQISIQLLLKKILFYIKCLIGQFSFVGFCLGIIGIVGIYYENYRKIILFLLTGFFFTGIFFSLISNLSPTKESLAILEQFYSLPNIFFSMLILFGICVLLINIKLKLFQIVFIILLLFIPFYQFNRNIKKMNIRNDYYTYDFGKNTMKTLPKESIFITTGDTLTYVFYYLQFVKKERPDIRMISVVQYESRVQKLLKEYPDLIDPKKLIGKKYFNEKSRIAQFTSVSFIKDVIDSNLSKNRVFFNLVIDENYKKYIEFFVPEGLVYHAAINKKEVKNKFINMGYNNLYNFYVYRNKYNIENTDDYFIKDIIVQYAKAHNYLGAEYANIDMDILAKNEFKYALNICPDDEEFIYNNFILNKKNKLKTKTKLDVKTEKIYNEGLKYAKKGDIDKAIYNFKKIIEIFPYYAPAHNNLGVMYMNMGVYNKAIAEYKEAMAISPELTDPYYNLGVIYSIYLKNKEKAIFYWNKYLEIYKDAPDKEIIKEQIEKLKNQ